VVLQSYPVKQLHAVEPLLVVALANWVQSNVPPELPAKTQVLFAEFQVDPLKQEHVVGLVFPVALVILEQLRVHTPLVVL
jgi:hypothetical protein